MSELVQVYSDLSIGGALVLSRDEADFPINPRVGTIIVKNQCLYAYIKIGGLESWYPFASKTHSFVHVQGVALLHWVVNHGLGTKNLWIQVKDATGNIISVGKRDIDDNSFTLNFTQAIVGTVLVVAPDSVDVPEVMASIVNVANSAVLIDSSGVRINGSYALTGANITQQITDAVAPKANSIDVYSKTEADTLLDVKSNLGHGHTVSDVSGLQLALDAKLNASAKAMNASSADSVAYTGIIGKPTTIAGAGIADVYTKTETDTRIEAIIGGGAAATQAALDLKLSTLVYAADMGNVASALTAILGV